MTNPTEKRPTGVAVTAALTPFMGGPVAFALFAFAIGARGEDGLFGNLAQAWAEGGWFMYAVLLTGGVVAMVSAALMFFGVQRGSAAVLVNAPLGALITAVGALGFMNGMSGAAAAVVHASPADRATIMAAATAESLTTSAFGMAGTAGLLASLALGCLFGVVVQTGVARKLLALAGGTFLVLAMLSVTSLLRLSDLMGLFKAVAHVNPIDRGHILEMGSDELSRFNIPFLGLLVLLAVIVAAGAAALKEAPRLAVLLPLLGFGGLVGLGAHAGARAFANQKTATLGAISPSYGLIDFKGYAGREPQWCLKGGEVRDCEEDRVVEPAALLDETASQVRSRREYSYDEKAPVELALGIGPKATAEALWQFIDAAKRAGATGLALTGEHEGAPLKVAGEIAGLAPLLQVRFSAVPIGVLPDDAPCEQHCETGTVKGATLIVDGKTFEEMPMVDESDLRDQVHVRVEPTLSPEQLVTLARAAAGNGRKLVVLLPSAE